MMVQEARVQQIRSRLEADVVAPAHADMEAKQADAKAKAAKVIEDGKASANVLEAMIVTWKQGGDAARDIFLMQKLEKVMISLVGTIQDVKIDKMTVLPKGDKTGNAAKAATFSEEIKAGVGVDLPALLKKLGG
jgi:flotillin